jgi:hypothetical protein
VSLAACSGELGERKGTIGPEEVEALRGLHAPVPRWDVPFLSLLGSFIHIMPLLCPSPNPMPRPEALRNDHCGDHVAPGSVNPGELKPLSGENGIIMANTQNLCLRTDFCCHWIDFSLLSYRDGLQVPERLFCEAPKE